MILEPVIPFVQFRPPPPPKKKTHDYGRSLRKCRNREHDPNNPWDWYIYLHLPPKSIIHVGRYTSPMDDMG